MQLKALRIAKLVLRDEHLDTLISIGNLALIYIGQE